MNHAFIKPIYLFILLLTITVGSIGWYRISGERFWQTIVQPKRDNWVIPYGSENMLRGAHMSGNWGGNVRGVKTQDEYYFEYLRDLNVNWVGISVALHVDDSMDPSVERVYSGVEIPTFQDEDLVRLITHLRQHGFHVYLTLAFEDQESQRATRPVFRWQLGDPNAVTNGEIKQLENWPWDPRHPNHTDFVQQFWQSYTDQAIHFAQLAESTGVELFSLGTETERLFRTRSGEYWPNDFGNELSKLVKEVRAVYSGKLTYDMLPYDTEAPGSKYLWDDLSLDVIGISGYYELVDNKPDTVLRVQELESAWSNIFQKYLFPLKSRYPDKPIVFTEFGYVVAVEAPYNHSSEERRNTVEKIIDENGNALDDAQEQQANIYEALLNTVEKNPGVVTGVFTWQESFPDQSNPFDIWGVRTKLAEQVVRNHYGKWREKQLGSGLDNGFILEPVTP